MGQDCKRRNDVVALIHTPSNMPPDTIFKTRSTMLHGDWDR
ncbi:hypothetical protein [Stenotrophomonas phage CM2]